MPASRQGPRAGQKLAFEAPLENWAEGMDYCAVAVPPAITAKLGTIGPVLVMARVNDSAPFKVSLFPVGGGKHYIRIKAAVRKETKTQTGDRIQIRFTVLDRAADVSIPKDLAAALKRAGAHADFKSIPPGQQNFLLRQIDAAARPETREKRIQAAIAAAQRRRDALAKKRK